MYMVYGHTIRLQMFLQGCFVKVHLSTCDQVGMHKLWLGLHSQGVSLTIAFFIW